MKILYLLSILLVLFSCRGKKTSHSSKGTKATGYEIQVPAFQKILDSANVKGSIMIYNLKEGTYYSNDFRWAKKGKLPASTFKITNSIIALEIGIVQNDSTLIPWNGTERRLNIWEQDLIFRDAFHYSCVPCYQEIARSIGYERMTDYLEKLDYGSMSVDSSNLDIFWLQGESRINQFQQIKFLERFYQSELPISEHTEQIMKRMMVMEDNNSYRLSGKTGWSIRNGDNNGWFAGYLETEANVYFFATNIEPHQQFDMDMFPMIRKEVTHKAFEQMKLIN